MRVEAGRIGPGLFLILAGAIPLAVREGLLETDAVAGAWRLWPLFLVAAGLGLLLRATPLRGAGGILAALLAGILVGSLLAVGTTGGFGSLACSVDGGSSFTTRSGVLARPDAASVSLTMNCGEATVETVPTAGWRISGRSADGSAPRIDEDGDRLAVRAGSGGGGFGALTRWTRLDAVIPTSTATMSVTLNAGTIDASAGAGLRTFDGTVNAGALTADLGAASGLDRLAMRVNAGDVRLTLPDASVSGSITVNAGAVALCVPADVGLRLTTKGFSLGGYDYAAAGLTESGGVWTSPGWASATHLIDLATTANAGAISLNPKDGCR